MLIVICSNLKINVIACIDVVGWIGGGSRDAGARYSGATELEQEDPPGREGARQPAEAGRRNQHRLQEVKTPGGSRSRDS